jgi:ABC-2 type transport system ATP-binding protein
MIEFSGVTRKYGPKVAVADLDLRIPAGELFAFLGPNGAGKTTTIKMLVGLLRPSRGNVRVCGFDTVTETRQVTHRTGYVPDQPFLYDKLTGHEFLRFVAEMRGLTGSQVDSAIDRQIERFELGEFIGELSETYSHGMKQRLVFASALVHQPSMLVVDEPMVGLDPRNTRMVKDLLRTLANSGTTIFMSTHTLSIAEEIADRIGIVNLGRLTFLGTLAELRAHVESASKGADRSASAHGNGHTTLEDLFLELTSPQNGREADRQEVPGEPCPGKAE